MILEGAVAKYNDSKLVKSASRHLPTFRIPYSDFHIQDSIFCPLSSVI